MTSHQVPVLLDIRQTAQLLGIAVPTVRKLLQYRKIPFYKVAGCIRFSQDDVLAYLASGRVEAMRQK